MTDPRHDDAGLDAVTGREAADDESGRKKRSERAGGRLVTVMVLVLALLIGGGYAAAYGLSSDDLPRGTEVDGVAVGGLTREEALLRLQEQVADPRARTPIRVTADDRSQQVMPQQAGLTLDLVSAVDEAGAGRSWAPERLWAYWTGGDDDLTASALVDDEAMTREIAELAEGFGARARDGSIRFVDGRPEVVPPVSGQGLDPDTTRAALEAAYLSGDPAQLEFTDVTPVIGDDEIQTALESAAEPAVAGPVTLVLGGAELRLTPQQFAPSLRFTRTGDELRLDVAPRRLARIVEQARGDAAAADAPVDATVEIRDGRPQVVPGRPGRTYPQAELARALLAASTDLATGPQARRAEVAATEAQPAFGGRDAQALGITEKVSEFTTYFPYAEYRNTNLGRATELVDGTLLKPGEVFSLNGVLGERTEANGFTVGTVISDGVFREELGGGVSQMATTAYNAGFFAGFEDVQHRPHSFYIDRYPVGREATVVFPVLDMAFRDDTEHGALVTADLTPSTPGSQGVLTVSIWSTKVWDIRAQTSDRYDYTAPDTRYLTDDGCIPNSGYSGFSVDVTRVFRNAGESEVVDRQTDTTAYTPSDTVVCGPAPGTGGGGNGGGGGGGRGGAGGGGGGRG